MIGNQIIIDTHWARLIVEFYAVIKMGGAVPCHSILCKELVKPNQYKFSLFFIENDIYSGLYKLYCEHKTFFALQYIF